MWPRDLISGALVASTLLAGSEAAVVPDRALSFFTKLVPRQEVSPSSDLTPPEESGEGSPDPEASGDSDDEPPAPSTSPFIGVPSETETNVTCDVKIDDFRDESDAKDIWNQSGAGKIGDEYIAKHGIENWVQDLDQDIFGEGPSQSWSCRDWPNQCGLIERCDDYEKTDYGTGAYYLYYSLQQLHGYLGAFQERIQDNGILGGLDVTKIQDDFEDKSTGGQNVPVIFAGVFSILGGFGAANPVFAGTMAIAGGAAVIIANAKDGPDKGSNGGSPMADRVKEMFTDLRGFVDNVNRAAFGYEGYDPEELIPEDMRKGDYKSAVMGLLGDGQWLAADPTDGLSETMDKMAHRMQQGLAWSMMRWARNAFIFIDQPVKEDECGTNYNAGTWDPDKGWCFRLFMVEDENRIHPVEDKLGDKLWDEPYSIDKLEAYRNAYDCWTANDGATGEPEYTTDLGDELVPCFYSMPVVRGTFFKVDGNAGTLQLFEDFAGQKKGVSLDPKIITDHTA